MSTPIILPNFAGGELSDTLYGHVDLDKYHIGAKLLLNFFVDYRGGVSNRPGTEYVQHCATDVDGGIRLIPFIVAEDQSYVLEFSDLLIRVFFSKVLITTVVSPYKEADLFQLRYEQSADVMTITHPAYPRYNLNRTSSTTFTLTAVVTGPVITTPTGLAAVASVGGPLTYAYQVTAVAVNGEESLPCAVVTETSAALDPTLGTPRTIVLSWTPVVGADAYNVYKAGPVETGAPDPTVLGYIGQTTDGNFVDNNIGPDFGLIPPEFFDPFAGTAYPTCVSYYQQRRTYAGADITPTVMDASQTGHYDNFDVSPAVLNSDAISINIASRQVNRIKHLVPMQTGLIAFTNGNAFLIHGADGSGFTPTNAAADPQASTGAGDLRPIIVNYNVLFNSYQGNAVRDLTFNFQTSSYYGEDRTRLASHLFQGKFLQDWAWAEEPFKLLWVVRTDGHALTMTYLPEQEIYGWAQHNTNGLFKSVCSVPEGNEDAVYFVVRRYIQTEGVWRNFLERLQSRIFDCSMDTWFLDCAVSNPLTVGTTTLNLSALSGTGITVTTDDNLLGGGGSYLIEGISPYGGAIATMVNTADATLWNLSVSREYMGLSYNPVSRRLYFSACVVIDDNVGDAGYTKVNATGFTLWSFDSGSVAPLANYDAQNYKNFYLCYIDIDTNVVTMLDVWDSTSAIPVGINGSDGTWRRMFQATTGLFPTQQFKMVQPDTDDVWVHTTGPECQVYVLRSADAFKHKLSPLTVAGAGHMEMLGLTANWMLVMSSTTVARTNGSIYTVPRTTTADEVTADELLGYFNVAQDVWMNTAYWRSAVNINGNCYFFGAARSGAKDFRLFEYVPPTPVGLWTGSSLAGGTITDITPWAAGTGPNTNCAAWQYNTKTGGGGQNLDELQRWSLTSMFNLPATDELILISQLTPQNTTLAGTDHDPVNYRLDCTYVDIGAGTFDYHEGFVTGYMDAAWAPTNLAGASYAVQYYREIDSFRECSNYDYGDDYTVRWFAFSVQPVVAGVFVWDNTGASNSTVLAKYTFVSGAAPVLSHVEFDTSWLAGYAAYAAAIANNNVVDQSVVMTNEFQPLGEYYQLDSGFVDGQSFWFGGQNPQTQLIDPTFPTYTGAAGPAPASTFAKITYGGGSTTTTINALCGTILITGGASPDYIGDIVLPLTQAFIPNDPFNTPAPILAGSWSYGPPVTSIDVSHLKGMRIGLVTDGIVNAEQIVPGSGLISWVNPATRVVCGLPYTSQFSTLKLDVGEPTIQGRRKAIPAVTIRMDKSSGMKFGTDDFSSMVQVKELSDDTSTLYRDLVIGSLVLLASGDARVNVYNGWSTKGVLTAQQTYPMPATILAVIPEVTLGDNLS